MEEHLVGELECLQQRRCLVGYREQSVVGNDDLGVDLVLELNDSVLGLHGPAATLKAEWPCDHSDGQGSNCLGDLGHNRRRARTGSAALTCRDEDHVGAFEGLLDVAAVFLGCLTSKFRVGTCTQAFGQLTSDVQLHVGIAHEERLCIGVDRDELHAAQASIDHPVDGVYPATTDADDLDYGQIVLWIAHHRCLLISGHPSGSACERPSPLSYPQVDLEGMKVPTSFSGWETTGSSRQTSTRRETRSHDQQRASSRTRTGLWWIDTSIVTRHASTTHVRTVARDLISSR